MIAPSATLGNNSNLIAQVDFRDFLKECVFVLFLLQSMARARTRFLFLSYVSCKTWPGPGPGPRPGCGSAADEVGEGRPIANSGAIPIPNPTSGGGR